VAPLRPLLPCGPGGPGKLRSQKVLI
jgi:hypothetical protein